MGWLQIDRRGDPMAGRSCEVARPAVFIAGRLYRLDGQCLIEAFIAFNSACLWLFLSGEGGGRRHGIAADYVIVYLHSRLSGLGACSNECPPPWAGLKRIMLDFVG